VVDGEKELRDKHKAKRCGCPSSGYVHSTTQEQRDLVIACICRAIEWHVKRHKL
jgi:hypothetical protein